MADRARPRLLLVTRNLPPAIGGMERLNRHMALELARGFDVAVVGPRGCAAFLEPSMCVREVAAKPLVRFFAAALIQSAALARRLRPKVVLAGSGLTAPFAWLAARVAGARCVVYVHGLDLIADYALYRWFWRPFIRRADLCVANSRHTAGLAEQIGVPGARIAIVHPGVDLPIDVAAGDFRRRFELGEGPLLLSVGRLIARKGLLEFVEHALPRIAAEFPEVRLVVIGNENPDLLHGDSSGLGARIRERAASLGLADVVRFLGPQDDATLAHAYVAANVHVFPVREVPGDVEGFGMVAVEAAAHGLPSVAFAVGGVPDAVAEGRSGHLAAPGDYARFAECVNALLRRRGDASLRASAREFAADFRWERFGERLRAALAPHGAQSGAP